VLFDNNSLKLSDIQDIKDLRKIPSLTKQSIRENFTELIPSNINSIDHNHSSTGGSTGDPLVYLLDNDSWSYATANNIVHWERTGYRYSNKYIALGSTSLYVNKNKSIKHVLYYKLKNKIGLNGVNMSDKICEEYTQMIKKRKIKFIYGYASAIYLLAKYVKKKNIRLDIIACMPTSEVLTDHYCETISEVFNCDIMNSYGASDGGITGFSHNGGIFEVGYNTIVIPENPGEPTSKILITNLFNYAMPFINYKIGDEVIFANKEDAKKYNGQSFEKVLGRISDIIYLENGNVLTGPGFTILFKDIPAEYYHIEKTGVNAITCTIIKLPNYTQNHEDNIL